LRWLSRRIYHDAQRKLQISKLTEKQDTKGHLAGQQVNSKAT
jgi:hypothetical protein